MILAPSVQVDDDGDVASLPCQREFRDFKVMSNASTGAVIELPCQHVYHAKCLEKWFEQRASCPLCLKEFGKVATWMQGGSDPIRHSCSSDLTCED